MGSVIVLGAKGRFGRAAVQAFHQAGWQVSAFGRGLDRKAFPQVRCIEGDAQDANALSKACAGMDVIVNSLNPPYPDWPKSMPILTGSVIAAAKVTGATVLIPGNVYNYGADMPAVLNEQTPWRPTTRKGKLRVEMEQAFRDAGVRTIVLRCGDFFESEDSGDWFSHHISAKSHLGQTLYPGPLDLVHAWAYLPDVARAAVALAEKRAEFTNMEEFAFPGYGVTGRQQMDEIARVLGLAQRHKGLPWPMLRLLGIFAPLMREVHEMRYLWQVPHRIDGGKMASVLPDFEATTFSHAVREALARKITLMEN